MSKKLLDSGRNTVQTKAVEPESKRFWMAGAGVKIFLMVEPEPEIWVPVPRT